jgi:3-phosphoshikimate 1-carboxyvinyltransferase
MSLAQRTLLGPAPSLRGTIRVPSDKSIAHRALICAALATGESNVFLREPGADVRSTLSAVRSLGVEATATDVEGGVEVKVLGLGDGNSIGQLHPGTGDCGNSGTSMRLLAGALAAGAGIATLVGDESLSRRPMARIADPLRAMGAEIDLTTGHAPIVVRGRRPLRAVEHDLTVASAQVLGAISLAALAADGRTVVRVPGLVRDHTERMLAALGARITRTTDATAAITTIDGPSALGPLTLSVPGDFSSAAAWLVAAAIHPDAEVGVEGVGLNPSRTALVNVLTAMGARITVERADDVVGEPVGSISVRGGATLRPISLGAGDVAPLIDELPLIAVAMAAADGTSEVRGAQELRVKESDRISTMTAALSNAGAHVEELPDGWRISRGRPAFANVQTRADHRVAMAMAIAAWTGVASAADLDDPQCVAISYPSFWDHARQIGALE